MIECDPHPSVPSPWTLRLYPWAPLKTAHSAAAPAIPPTNWAAQ